MASAKGSSRILVTLLVTLVKIAAAVYAGLVLVFLVFQRSFIYMPTPATRAHDGANVLDVPGARIRISGRPLDAPRAVLYFGGNAEDVAYTVPDLAAAFPDRAIYAVHYRGYSGSTGRTTEKALRDDARRAFRMVHERHPDVIVVGRSLGSSLAIQLAAEEPVTRLVLITPFESILAIARRVAPFLPMGVLLADRYESWRYAPRVTCPTLVLAASHDELVLPADTGRLLAAFPPGVTRHRVIDGADHNSLSESPDFWPAVVAGR
jgi:pimeloyl-ACP methyl ester carboxylesterase